jgi:hypothetical protein
MILAVLSIREFMKRLSPVPKERLIGLIHIVPVWEIPDLKNTGMTSITISLP